MMMTQTKPRVQGASGGTSTPSTNGALVRSDQLARIIDAIGWGEIGGLVAGDKSVYFDNTPLQNTDGSYNFQNISVQARNGVLTQDPLDGFPDVEAETQVSTQVKHDTPIVRTITNAYTDAIRITLATPQLYAMTDKGDQNATALVLSIQVQDASGGDYVEVTQTEVNARALSRYQWNVELDLRSYTKPINVKVQRLTDDSSSSQMQNDSYWDSYTEITLAQLRYPHIALIGLQLDAQQFSGIPTRGYDCYGLLIQVPTNYDPPTRTYSGTWDGTFKLAWSDNPAWCFYDLLTNDRYGLGAYIGDSTPDKWTLYQIAQYCDELVPNGYGGYEPRFTCNLYLQSADDALTVISNMASVFRGMVYYAAGTIFASQDAPRDASPALFTPANVVNGQFVYQGVARTARHTVALVSWDDPSNQYQTQIEYVADDEAVARFGIIETQLAAFGCTSQAQARRLGKWLLYTEKYETETVTFQAGLDAFGVMPGAIVAIQDPWRAGKRLGGRIISATTTQVTIDSAVELLAGHSYRLMCILPDGTSQTRNVTTAAGTTSILNVDTAFDSAPQERGIWLLSQDDLAPQLFRIIGVTRDDKHLTTLTGLAYHPEKFDYVEKDITFEESSISAIGVQPSAVRNVAVTESLVEISSGIVSNRATVSWTGDTGRYVVSYTSDVAPAATLPETTAQLIDIDGLLPGTYVFSVVQYNALGKVSLPSQVTKILFGKTAPPQNITGFNVTKSEGFALCQWDASPDLDVRVGGSIVIRHSMLTNAATWEDGVVLDTFQGLQVSGIVPLVEGTYMAKAVDSSGNYSQIAASFVATEGMLTGFTTVASSEQSPAFAGSKTNVAYDPAQHAIKLDSQKTIAEMTDNISAWPRISSLGGIAASGIYAFDTPIDCGTVATRRFEADVSVNSYDTGDFISFRGNVSTWPCIASVAVNDCDATLQIAITNDDPAGSPTWSPWTPFMVSDFTCRAAKFQLLLESGSPNHNIAVNTLRVDVKTANY